MLSASGIGKDMRVEQPDPFEHFRVLHGKGQRYITPHGVADHDAFFHLQAFQDMVHDLSLQLHGMQRRHTHSLFPWPGRSMVITRNSFESLDAKSFHIFESSVNPWRRTSTFPFPLSE